MGDAHRPDAPARSRKTDFERDLDARGAVLAQQEGQRFEDRLGGGLGERSKTSDVLFHGVQDPPACNRRHDGLKRPAVRGECIGTPPFRLHRLHQARLHEPAQPRGQDAGSDARARAQLLEAAGTPEQVPHQNEGPAIPHAVQGTAHRVEDLAGARDRRGWGTGYSHAHL